MVEYKDLSVVLNGKGLSIEVEVPQYKFYDNIYIKEIYLDTHITYNAGGPSESALKIFDSNTVEIEEGQNREFKNIKVLISEKDILDAVSSKTSVLPSLENDLLFVYIKTNDDFGPDTPCGYDNQYTIGVTFNTCILYNKFMQVIKELYQECPIPKHFVDYFLLFEGMVYSVESKHYIEAINIYKRLFDRKDITVNNTNSCNCNKHG